LYELAAMLEIIARLLHPGPTLLYRGEGYEASQAGMKSQHRQPHESWDFIPAFAGYGSDMFVFAKAGTTGQPLRA
jgi:hypothetical protein